PDLLRDVVSLGMIKEVEIQSGEAGASIRFTFELTTPACPIRDQLEAQARAAVAALPGVAHVDVRMAAHVRSVGGLPLL
ncbi:MAG: iron-sulfur cluster assembly protein, partial [Chloroflexi bacterium]|nr:iron-sulfur cluster assembly protein [Chloroflexota bacterium]